MSPAYPSFIDTPIGSVRDTLTSLNVYAPVVDLLAEAAAGADGDVIEDCIKRMIYTQMTPATLDAEEFDSLLSYIPAMASTYAAFGNDEIEFHRVARMALAYAVGEHDVPGNHILDLSTDGFLLDGVIGATMHACIEKEYVSPAADDLEWLGKHRDQLSPFAALIREREDISREFCEMLLSEYEQGVSPALQLGTL